MVGHDLLRRKIDNADSIAVLIGDEGLVRQGGRHPGHAEKCHAKADAVKEAQRAAAQFVASEASTFFLSAARPDR